MLDFVYLCWRWDISAGLVTIKLLNYYCEMGPGRAEIYFPSSPGPNPPGFYPGFHVDFSPQILILAYAVLPLFACVRSLSSWSSSEKLRQQHRIGMCPSCGRDLDAIAKLNEYEVVHVHTTIPYAGPYPVTFEGKCPVCGDMVVVHGATRWRVPWQFWVSVSVLFIIIVLGGAILLFTPVRTRV